ncbi:MAG: N-6 DNA methylase [Prevotellaceae bacterium]|jgi:type I restriction enzyme M protein|nr:N-6 DNA methylase [Prevotellaceae bacterium]
MAIYQKELKDGYIIDYISGQEVKVTPEEVEATQVFSKRLVEEYGYPKENIQTRPQYFVRKTPSDEIRKEYPVDIAVFNGISRVESDLIGIVECKKKSRKDGLEQLKLYMDMCSSVLWGVWFNGDEQINLQKIKKDGDILYMEIPNIPKQGQRIEDVGKYKRRDLKPAKDLKSHFKVINNYLYGNMKKDDTSTRNRAKQIINLLFCKIYDEKYTGQNEEVFFRAGVNEEKDIVEKRIKDLFIQVKVRFSDVFEDEDAITLDSDSIVFAVGQIQEFCITESERDVIGDAFEVFVSKALKDGEGQFFTPRNVIKMMVDIIDPDENSMIIDPACGTGGFLIESLRHVWEKIEAKAKNLGWLETRSKEEKQYVASTCFRGIDKDSFMAKVTKAYMAIIGDGRGGVFCENSLEYPKEWNSKCQDKIDLGKFDVVFTNPPFGSKIPVKEENILKQYDTGFQWRYNDDTDHWEKTGKLKKQEEPQILFIERCLSLLKEGGRMAIVLPSGILGNERETYLRQYILSKGFLFAIVELPSETFSPHVTINTSVLFIQKGKNEKKDIFISINEYCGHDKKGRQTDKDDIPAVSGIYHKSRVANENNFFIKPDLLEHSFVAKRYLRKYIDNLVKIESSKYKIVDFGNIIVSIHNGANIDDASIYVEKKQGIPYILVKTVTKEGINFENLKYIKQSLETNRDVIKNIVDENSIVMTRAGNSGIAANIPPDLVGGVASGFLINIKIRKNINPYYIVSYLNSEYGQLQLEKITSGSILQSIRSSELKKIKIILPTEEIQNAIGNKIKEAVYAASVIRRKIEDAEKDITKLI